MKRLFLWLLPFVVILAATGAQGAACKLILTYAQGDGANKATLTAVDTEDVPSPVAGDILSVIIVGDEPPADYDRAWRFLLGEKRLRFRNDPAPKRFEGLVPNGTSWQISFTDSTQRCEEHNFPLNSPSDGGAPPRQERNESPGVQDCQMKTVYDRARNEVNLYFDENCLPLEARELPRDVDDNDVINVFLAVPEDAASRISAFTVQVQGNIQGEIFTIVGETELAAGRTVGARPQALTRGGDAVNRRIYLLGSYGPYSSPSMSLTLSSKTDNASPPRTYVLRINKNYIAGLRLGVGESGLRRGDFRLVRDPASGNTVVVDRSPDNGDLRPALFVNFYGCRLWERAFWNGRDIEEIPELADRIHPLVGIGLQDFGDEYYAGLSFEMAKGLDVFWAIQFLKTARLTRGLAPGEVFAGEPSELPIQDSWKAQRMFGLSLDVRIAARVLGGLFGSGKE